MHEDKLYAIALRCAELNAQGCAFGCAGCQYNVFNYVDDVREASLLKANAYTDYDRQQRLHKKVEAARNAEDFGYGIWTLLVIGFLIWMCWSIKSCVTNDSYTPPPQQSLIENMSNEQLTKNIARYHGTPKAIDYIVTLLKRVIKDINGDGLINCIDYSLGFRMLYGDEAFIIVNVNRFTGMNHMFIQLYYGGEEYDVEPQGTASRWTMAENWGDRYNSIYNTNRTYEYGKFIGDR